MSFYTNKIYPWILDNTDPKELAALRLSNLKDTKGEILEVGIGTGANLPFYPKEIKRITAVEPSESMHQRAQIKAYKNNITIDWYQGKGESLKFSDDSFDTVVSSGLLCSVDDVDKVLNEMYRVLKPGGKFYFLEHGISKNKKIRKLQIRFNRVNNVIACGCNLTRNIENHIRNSAFEIIEVFHVETFAGINKLYPPVHGTATKKSI